MSRMHCTCPACDTVVKLDDESAAGTKITCPECAAVFRVPEADEAASGEERERRPRPRKAAATGMKPGMIVALILAPVLLGMVGLAAGGGWLMWKYLTPGKEVASGPSLSNAPLP